MDLDKNDVNTFIESVDSLKDLSNKILIFTTKFGNYIAKALSYILRKNNIENEIIFDIDYQNPLLHIILFSQKVQIFPKNYIIYQLEQKDISKWIDTKYEISIYNSIKTFDYSKSNINKFHYIIKKKMYYFPIPLISIENLYNINIKNIIPQNNILFYGSMNDIRSLKLKYLNKLLYPKYNIKIINNLYGDKLIYEILNSKIVLNIHFYKNAILETCRINEILSCHRTVISEKPNIIDEDNYELYKNNVIFTDSINDMYNKIIEILDNNMYNIEIIDFDNHPINSYNICDLL
jgi:hypothetical protein